MCVSLSPALKSALSASGPCYFQLVTYKVRPKKNQITKEIMFYLPALKSSFSSFFVFLLSLSLSHLFESPSISPSLSFYSLSSILHLHSFLPLHLPHLAFHGGHPTPPPLPAKRADIWPSRCVRSSIDSER